MEGCHELHKLCELRIPEILNEAARAGPEGLPVTDDPAFRTDLELCRRWGFALRCEHGRAVLPFDQDSLIPAWIEQETPAIAWGRLFAIGFLEIGSTNEEALRLADSGAPSGTLICAERQTAGRGRKGRSWISPAGAGIYCTLVIRPGQPPDRWPLLAHTASVAVAEALKDALLECGAVNSPSPDLKWPNDVYLSGKKTAGILIETVSGKSPAAVVGIGINVREESGPAELYDQATCIDKEAGGEIPRRRLLVHCLHRFQECYGLFERQEHRELLQRWKRLSSMWDGVPVWIDDGSRRRAGITSGLTELGALRIRNEDGTEETLLAADVTVRRAREET